MCVDNKCGNISILYITEEQKDTDHDIAELYFTAFPN